MITKTFCKDCLFSYELGSTRIVNGELPPGLTVEDNVISGVPNTTGIYTIKVIQSDNTIDDLVISIVERIFKGCYLQEDS